MTIRRRPSRPVPCMHKCKKPTPVTMFVRWHPFKKDWEVRRCIHCQKDSAYDSRAEK
mgnify:CR=1 FL=1